MNKKLVKIFSTLIICFPILQQYRSPFSGVPLAEFLSMLCLPFLLLNFKLKKNRVWYSYIFCITLVFYNLFFIIWGNQFNIPIKNTNILIGTIRLSFHFFLIFLGSNSLFDIGYSIKVYKLLGILTTAYLTIQFLTFHLFNLTLPWILPFLKVYQEGYNDIDFNSFFMDFYRPYSIFLEPGFYVQFILPLLVILLIDNRNKDVKTAIFLTIGIVLSTSGQGLMLLPVVWGSYVVLKYKRNILKFIGGLIISLFVIFLIRDTEIVSRSLGRLFGGENTSSYLRIYQPLELYDRLSFSNQIVGIGYNNIEAVFGNFYLNSIGFLLISTGIIGTLIYFLYVLTLFFQLKIVSSRVILFIFTILLFVSGIVTSGTTVFYFCILLGLELESFKTYKGDNDEIIH